MRSRHIFKLRKYVKFEKFNSINCIEGNIEKKFYRASNMCCMKRIILLSDYGKKLNLNVRKRINRLPIWKLSKKYGVKFLAKFNMKNFRNLLFFLNYNKEEVIEISNNFSGGKGHINCIYLQTITKDEEIYVAMLVAPFTTKWKTKGVVAVGNTFIAKDKTCIIVKKSNLKDNLFIAIKNTDIKQDDKCKLESILIEGKDIINDTKGRNLLGEEFDVNFVIMREDGKIRYIEVDDVNGVVETMAPVEFDKMFKTDFDIVNIDSVNFINKIID
jgi:hypothetical protein